MDDQHEDAAAATGRVGHHAADYYASDRGPLAFDRSEPRWTQFFGRVADELIRVLRPQRVFVVGCARGLLVEALWDRGVSAWGRDVSAAAVSEVRSDVRRHCSVGGLAEPIKGRFDLVTCIGDLDRVPEAEALRAIAAMTVAADRVVFSSAPGDVIGPTNLDVGPLLSWMRAFAGRGFTPLIGVTLPSIAPQALVFERREAPPSEDHLLACAEIVRGRLQAAHDARRLAQLSGRAAERDAALAERDRAVAERDAALAERDRAAEERERSNRTAGNEIASLQRALDEVLQKWARLNEAHEAVLRSTSWRLTSSLRSGAERLPAPVRRRARQALQLAYWSATLQLADRLRRRRDARRLAAPEGSAGPDADPRLIENRGAAEAAPPRPTLDGEEKLRGGEGGDELARLLRSVVEEPGLTVRGSHDVAVRQGRLVATSDDPNISITCEPPLPAGWYRLSAGIEKLRATPQVFFNFGEGFTAAASAFVPFIRDGHHEVVLHLPRPVIALRYDPDEMPGPLDRLSFGLTPLRGPAWQHLLRGEVAAARARGESAGDALRTLRAHARSDRIVALAPPSDAKPQSRNPDYQTWIRRYDYDAAQGDREATIARIDALAHTPTISVLMPTYNTPKRLLVEAIESVRAQIYPHWELCIADDCSTERHVRPILASYARRDPRIKVVHRAQNGHISEATNSAFALATGEWVVLLDHDDLLREHALAEVALAVAARPDAVLVYSDEDKIDEADGLRLDPFFKPDFSPDLLRGQNYLNHMTALRAARVRDVGGWRKGFEGSQDYDINLRVVETARPGQVVHVPKVLYHWRAVKGSTALGTDEKENYPFEAGMRALVEHLERCRLPARVEPIPEFNHYRVAHRVPDPEPLVSLIIPTKDRVEILRVCVDSILKRTTYGAFEVLIVDNGSVLPETHAYFDALRADPRIRILPYPHPFNYSAINNFAAGHARGTVLGLVNNDIEVITPDWLTEMVGHACRPEIGCVGAKLYYPDDTLQHGGVILGLGGVAGHSHKHFPRAHPGYFARLRLTQNLSAVTAACLVVRKAVFDEVGGLDEVDLKVAFNDVDFCIRVREAGYLNLWTPFAELYHHESISRGAEDTPEKVKRFIGEINVMKNRWGEALLRDPFYSPNLTIDREDFTIRR